MRINMFLAVTLAATCGMGQLSAQKAQTAGTTTTALAELSVSQETTNPGGVAQIKVSLTEPKPISTGSFDFSGGYDLLGIALNDPAQHTHGLAWPSASGLRVVTGSPIATFGMSNPDYPILTLTVRMPASAKLGSTLPVHLDASSIQLIDANGSPYQTKVDDGSITVQATSSVEDVIPGSDVVPAGGTFQILGRNLPTDLRIKIVDTDTDLTWVSATEVGGVALAPTEMHGSEILYRTKYGTLSYYAYQRTRDAFPSSYPALTTVEPLFPKTGSSSAAVAFPVAALDTIQALLVQNSHLEPVTVSFSRAYASGVVEQAAPVVLPAASRLARGLSEVFGSPCVDACTVTVTATDSIHAMGAVVDAAMTRVQILAPQ